MPASSPPLPFAPFLLLEFFISRHVVTMLLEVAFLIFRHSDTVSSAVFTLLKSTSRWMGALLSSLSRTVLRQSSTASLIAVTTRMTMSGTALRAGLLAPKMEKIWRNQSVDGCVGGVGTVRTPSIIMKRK
jgi:hypothetical protein